MSKYAIAGWLSVAALVGACSEEAEPLMEADAGTGGATDAGVGGTGGGGGAAGSAGSSGGAAGVAGGGGSAGASGAAGAVSPTLILAGVAEKFVSRTGAEISQAGAYVVGTKGSDYPLLEDVGSNCDKFDGRAFSHYPTDAPNAGIITITGGTGGDIVLEPIEEPPDDLIYENRLGDEHPWLPGDALHIVAAGAEVPAFDLAYEFPERVVPTSPDFSKYGEALFVLNRAKGLTLQWEPTEGFVAVKINQYDSPEYEAGGGFGVGCFFPAEDGLGIVPAELTAQLDPADALGTASSRTTMYFGGFARATTTVGPYEVRWESWNEVGIDVNVE